MRNVFATLALAGAITAALLPCAAKAAEPQDQFRFGPGTQWYQPYGNGKRVKVEQTHQRAARHIRRGVERVTETVTAAIAQPSRYISGRLICALNVNSALAERGIKGPGGASSIAFRSWGSRTHHPKPGDVAFNWRSGGGHVSMVAKVDADGTVWVWNPSPKGRGWQLRRNPYRSEYRTAA